MDAILTKITKCANRIILEVLCIALYRHQVSTQLPQFTMVRQLNSSGAVQVAAS